MKRPLIGLLIVALLPLAAACGSDESDTPSPAAKASATPAAALSLNAEEQEQLDKAQKQLAAYCETKGDAPVGSVAIVESLLTYGADTRTTDGTLGDAISKTSDELHSCGADGLAKRLDKAIHRGG